MPDNPYSSFGRQQLTIEISTQVGKRNKIGSQCYAPLPFLLGVSPGSRGRGEDLQGRLVEKGCWFCCWELFYVVRGCDSGIILNWLKLTHG